MDVDTYAEYLKTRGHKVVQTDSCYWRSEDGFFFASVPSHRLIEPARIEMLKVFFEGKAVGIRYPAPPTSNSDKDSYQIVCSNPSYDFGSLHQKARNQTRRGLENCQVRQIDFDYLADHGEPLIIESFERQGRIRTGNPGAFQRHCNSWKSVEGFEVWGAFIEDELTAFMIVQLLEDFCHIEWIYSSGRYLRAYPNNALVFTVTKEMLSRPGISQVSYGLEPLKSLQGLARFKLRMGYEKRPLKQRVVFNPLLKPFFNRATYPLLAAYAQRQPQSEFWQKVEGVMRICRGV